MPLLGPNGLPLNTDPPEGAEPVPDEADAATEVPQVIPAITAFIVYQLPTGQWQVADDLNAPIVTQRPPHGDDFTAGCANVERDVHTQEAAVAAANIILSNVGQAVIQAQMQFGKQVRDQAEMEQTRAKLEAEVARRTRR